MRAAIIGLYNSGSSVLSRIVEDLGADIGRPLWHSHFESKNLAKKLRAWWSEPELVETVGWESRVEYLRLWAQYHEASSDLVCAKHPLLCLSAEDLDRAWGPEFKAIRASRPFETSVRQLEKRDWFEEPEIIQRTLFDACEKYFRNRKHPAIEIEYDDLLEDPLGTVERISFFLELELDNWRIRRAASLVESAPEADKTREG